MMMVVTFGIVGCVEVLVLGGSMLRVGVSGNGDGKGGGCQGEVVAALVAIVPVIFVCLSFVIVYYIGGVEVTWQLFSIV